MVVSIQKSCLIASGLRCKALLYIDNAICYVMNTLNFNGKWSVLHASKIENGIIRRVAPQSAIHSDGWHSYNGLVDLGYQEHYPLSAEAIRRRTWEYCAAWR